MVRALIFAYEVEFASEVADYKRKMADSVVK